MWQALHCRPWRSYIVFPSGKFKKGHTHRGYVKTVRKLDVNVATVFTMRHKLLNMMESVLLEERVELDESFVKASHKVLSQEGRTCMDWNDCGKDQEGPLETEGMHRLWSEQ